MKHIEPHAVVLLVLWLAWVITQCNAEEAPKRIPARENRHDLRRSTG